MKKKVLFIIDHLGIGGVQEFILNYVKFSKHQEITVVSLFGADVYSQKITAAGGTTIFLSDLTYNYINILSFKIFPKFNKYVAENIKNFEAVHLKLFATFLYSSLLKLYRHPQVFPGLDASKYQLPLPLRILYRLYANQYTHFYLPSFYWNEYSYIQRERLINQSYFVTKRHSLTPIRYPHQFVLLAIGRCIKQKGFDEVIKLFQLIQTLSNLDVGLYVIGDGPHKHQLTQTPVKNLYFTGNILNLDDYLESAHMIIKMAKQEGPNSVVREALMSGKWVASTLETTECQKLWEEELLIKIDRTNLKTSATTIITKLLEKSPKDETLIAKAQMLWSPEEVLKNYRVD